MRESIGGAMIFWIVLFLFSIFITFIAFIIKYARVYKIKNAIVNNIVKSEGNFSRNDIENQLNSMGYQTNGQYKICRYFPSDMGEFYYVELYSVTEFPMIGNILAYKVKIKGETRLIELNEDNVDLASQGEPWFYGTSDQCYLCVLGNMCQKVTVE